MIHGSGTTLRGSDYARFADAEVALGRSHLLRREHPAVPFATARDGAAFKRIPNSIRADLEPAGTEQARHKPDRSWRHQRHGGWRIAEWAVVRAGSKAGIAARNAVIEELKARLEHERGRSRTEIDRLSAELVEARKG